MVEEVLDPIERACSVLGLTEEQCSVVREAAEESCGPRRKRRPSEFNIFMGKCVKEETGPVTERFKRCVEKWKEMKGRGAQQ